MNPIRNFQYMMARLGSNPISNGARKLLILAGLTALVYAPHALAQGFTALAPIPGLTDQSATSVVNSATLAAFFNNLYKYLIGIAAALAVIEIIWGGLEYSTQDSVSKQSNGRERITQAIFGLILVLSPVLVFSIINPSILNLSINLSPINLDVAPIINGPSSVVGTEQIIEPGADQTGAVAAAQEACRAAGGTPETRGNVSGSETVTCIQQNQNAVPSGDTSITANQCASLVGHSVGGSQGLQPTVVPSSTASDCGASNINDLLGAYTLTYCKNITGGGVCLYNQ